MSVNTLTVYLGFGGANTMRSLTGMDASSLRRTIAVLSAPRLVCVEVS